MLFPGWTASCWLLMILLLATFAAAQQSKPPAALLPQAPTVSPVTPVAAKAMPQAHAFWDHKNAWLFSGVGVFRALDYTSTRNMRDRGRQEILLSNWVVDNRPLFIGIEAAATGLSIGHISGAAFGDARNYALKSGHHYPVQ